MLTALHDLLMPLDPGGSGPRQVRWHNQVNGIGPQMDRVQRAIGILSGQQPLERAHDQLLD